MSQPELNTLAEIQFIEENVRINNILANMAYTWSTDSFMSDEFEKCISLKLDDSDDDLNYRRITAEYPLMGLHTPSDGSLVAVLDFDISDELPSSSNREEACTSSNH